MAKFERARVRGLTDRDWLRVADALSDTEFSFMPHQLAVQAGIRSEVAMGLLLALLDVDMATADWLVYHSCCDYPVDRASYQSGFPRRYDTAELERESVDCEECDDEITPGSVSFDLEFRLREQVELV